MGCILSKYKTKFSPNSNFIKNLTERKSSCGLTEYWKEKERDFRNNFLNDKNKNKSSAKASEFRISKLLDRGSYGSVTLTTHMKTGIVYATKIIPKKKIVYTDLVS